MAQVDNAQAKGGNKLQEIVGDKFLTRDGKDISFKDGLSGNVLVGIYFSAHWCPPCRGFTPRLKAAYEKWKKDGHKIEIIFVTSDQDEQAFKGYFEEQGNWLALHWGSEKIAEIKQKYGVRGIPTFIMLDANGNTVDDKARNGVAQDADKAIQVWLK
mmetsp:Transcript_44399/g.71121  ORF Transcript_44399/g.71121 Transcript_44399/m.71121 type:complete len:157 (-) Transcript_44399:80-550(-)